MARLVTITISISCSSVQHGDALVSALPEIRSHRATIIHSAHLQPFHQITQTDAKCHTLYILSHHAFKKRIMSGEQILYSPEDPTEIDSEYATCWSADGIAIQTDI